MKLTYIVVISLSALACSAPASHDTGDTGDSEEAITGAACNRHQLLSAADPARARTIERGLVWVDANVPYSQTRQHNGYRTDCSGFVSMCWELGTSYTTADFSTGGGESSKLTSYDELLPGDALVRRSGGEGHIFLFAGWQDANHTNACVIEERSTALGIQFHTRTTSSMRSSGYRPIRADKLAGDENAAPGNPPGNSGGGAGGVPPPAPPSGPTCASDGDCNPGNDGSGMICTHHQCVPGCHIDAQCPGVTTCVGGACR